MADPFDTDVTGLVAELDDGGDTGHQPALESLICLTEPLRGHSWTVAEELVIGRSARSDVVLDVSAVSRRHARIRRQDGGYLLEDLGSRNGTLVNGQRIDEHSLAFGDRITIGGEVTFLFALHSRLQERLAAAQKMEALGRLLGGVVHDFKNLLACIVSNAQVLSENLDDRALAGECIEDTLLAARRGAEMAQQLLAYSRRSGGLEQVELGGLLDDVVRLLRRGLPPAVELVVAPAPAVVLGDRAQLCQMLLNLCVNARDAVGDRGTIRIVVEDDAARGRVVVEVSDDGCGMTDDVRDRLFEPFFTTKRAGEGSGLGMAVVSGIVEGHGGEIEVDTGPGRGTAIRISLPLLDSASAAPSGAGVFRASTSPMEAIVLLVDDDELVLRGTRRVIERMGCEVVCALGSEEGLRVARDLRGRIALAVVDYIMPGMGGDDLVLELRRLDPDLKLVMMTGTVDRAAIERLEKLVDRFVSKPCEPAKLRAVVAALLDRPVD